MSRAVAAESTAAKRLQKIQNNQQERLLALQRDQEALQEQARVVQLHADNVDKALVVINSALDSGLGSTGASNLCGISDL